MAATANRVGAPVTPNITTAGVVGTSDQVRTFQTDKLQPLYVRPCVVTNMHATEVLYVLVNEIDASASNFLVKLVAGQAADVSFQGRLSVEVVSLFYAATAAYTDVLVKGWKA